MNVQCASLPVCVGLSRCLPSSARHLLRSAPFSHDSGRKRLSNRSERSSPRPRFAGGHKGARYPAATRAEASGTKYKLAPLCTTLRTRAAPSSPECTRSVVSSDATPRFAPCRLPLLAEGNARGKRCEHQDGAGAAAGARAREAPGALRGAALRACCSPLSAEQRRSALEDVVTCVRDGAFCFHAISFSSPRRWSWRRRSSPRRKQRRAGCALGGDLGVCAFTARCLAPNDIVSHLTDNVARLTKYSGEKDEEASRNRARPARGGPRERAGARYFSIICRAARNAWPIAWRRINLL